MKEQIITIETLENYQLCINRAIETQQPVKIRLLKNIAYASGIDMKNVMVVMCEEYDEIRPINYQQKQLKKIRQVG